MQSLKFIFLFWLLVLAQFGLAQNYKIAGYVEDINTGERIIGAQIYDSINNKYTQSNNYGFFSFSSISSKNAVEVSYLGYKTEMLYFSINRDTLLILKINPVIEIKEVVVVSSQYEHHVNTSLGLTLVSAKSLRSIPALGETDLLKAIQMQPGIKGGVEGSAGIYVRGGGSGENLFLLDDVPIYNVSHFYGFFSAFNSAAVKDIKLIKGCFPARYGGRTSSVIDVRSLDGNNKSLAGEVSIGIISAKATLEGPLWNKKTTFMISGRRSYFDLFTEPLKNQGAIDNSFPNYYFYDLNARVAHTFSQKDKIYLSFYKGKDYIKNSITNEEITGETETYSESRNETSGWGNIIGSLRWNHVFGNSLFANTTLAYSNYNYFTEDKYSSNDYKKLTNVSNQSNYHSKYTSNINDLIAETDFDYSVSNNHMLKFGGGCTFHTFNPGKSAYDMYNQEFNQKSDTSYINDLVMADELNFYIEDEFKITRKFTLNAGTRFSGFISENDQNFNFEPRLSANYMVLDNLAIKAGYSRMVQYIQLLSSSGLTRPTDLWIPSVKGVKPLKSDQINMGFTFNWDKVAFLSVEIYQKWLNNTTDFKNGASLATDQSPWNTKTIQGNGTAKGLEIAIEKQQGRFKGSIFYTLSNADRKYEDLNSGINFPFKYDRRHDLSISMNYQLSDKWDISAVWVFGTGYPVTLSNEKYLPALGIYNLDSEYGGEIDYYPSRNNYRLPAYHRLDLGLHRKKHTRLGESTLSFDIFNVYNHKNAINAYFSGYRIKTLSYSHLLPVIPSITYSIRF